MTNTAGNNNYSTSHYVYIFISLFFCLGEYYDAYVKFIAFTKIVDFFSSFINKECKSKQYVG